MELIAVPITTLVRRSRSVLVHHGDQALARGLELDERVVLYDELTGEFFSGSVADVTFELEDTDYRIEIGVRLPDELALERLTGMRSSTRLLSTQEVAELLGDLRGLPIPASRTAEPARHTTAGR